MASVLSILTGSVRLLGAVAQGVALKAGDAKDALYAMNSLLDSLNIQSLSVYTRSIDEYVLVPGKQAYTLGPTGDIQVAPQVRPTNIDRAQLRVINVVPNLDLPLEVLTDQQWAAIRIKDLVSPIPNKIFLLGDFPDNTLKLWPTPSIAHHLILWTWNQLSTTSSVNSELLLPPGYERMLRYNLAVELAPEYGVLPSPQVIEIAQETLARVKVNNAQLAELRCDPGTLSRSTSGFNYLTGE